MRIFLLRFGVLAGILALILTGCPSTISTPSRDFARMAIGLKLDLVPGDHPWCNDPGPAFASVEECRKTQKFRVSWDRPDDTVGLRGYRFYLDTNAHGSIPPGTKWADIQKSTGFAEVLIGPALGSKDSLIFAIGTPQKKPDSLNTTRPRILRLDTTGSFSNQGVATMAILPVYEDADAGRPGYGYAEIGDRKPPIPVRIDIETFAREFRASWERPIDPTSFFDPRADTGIIQHYRVELRLGGTGIDKRISRFAPRIIALVDGDTVAWRDSAATLDAKGQVDGMRFILPDSGHFHPNRSFPEQDRIRLLVSNLAPLDTFRLWAMPVDLAGNTQSVIYEYKIILTDTTQPEKPKLEADTAATTRNRLVVRWLPSRDSVVSNGVLSRPDSSDFGILDYRLRREALIDSQARVLAETTITAGLTPGQTHYQDTVLRLAPGSTYRFIVFARDSSGHRSLADTLVLRTRDVAFSPAESALTCPPGFIPMPGKRMIVGDTSTSAQADERPARTRDGSAVLTPYVASFCIEPTEHRDSSGAFVTAKSWQEAQDLCAEVSPADSTGLCTEVQWERACKGDDSLPHLYGYLGDRRDPSMLLSQCNQGTSDSLPAFDPDLRSRQCLTGEGVFDMPGQLSEWVRDPYDASAMSRITADTLPFGFTLADSGTSHSFRGGNFLRPNVPSSQLQLMARCTNRDLPFEVRPKFKAECVDTVPRLLALFGTAFDQHRCLPFKRPSTEPIQYIERLLDSVTFEVTYSDSVKDLLRLTPDSISKGRLALSARATGINLAAVRFIDANGRIHEDTLEARELRDTTEAVRRQVLAREAGVGWKPVEENGKVWVRLLYGYAQTSSRPARENYASRVIGFRCCAKPR